MAERTRMLSLQSYTWKALPPFPSTHRTPSMLLLSPQESQLQQGRGYTLPSFTHTDISAVLLLGGAAATAGFGPAPPRSRLAFPAFTG